VRVFSIKSSPRRGWVLHPLNAHDSAYANILFLFQVTNLSPSIAISMNYVDSSNIDKALEVTRLEGLVDPDSFDVYNKLAAVKDNRFVSFCCSLSVLHFKFTRPAQCLSASFSLCPRATRERQKGSRSRSREALNSQDSRFVRTYVCAFTCAFCVCLL